MTTDDHEVLSDCPIPTCPGVGERAVHRPGYVRCDQDECVMVESIPVPVWEALPRSTSRTPERVYTQKQLEDEIDLRIHGYCTCPECGQSPIVHPHGICTKASSDFCTTCYDKKREA
jgi:hypothetical protein